MIVLVYVVMDYEFLMKVVMMEVTQVVKVIVVQVDQDMIVQVVMKHNPTHVSRYARII